MADCDVGLPIGLPRDAGGTSPQPREIDVQRAPARGAARRKKAHQPVPA